MSVKQQILQQLQQFAAAGSGPFQLDQSVPAGRLGAAVLTVDRLACAFEVLYVASPRLCVKTLDELKQISNDLCGKLSYLLEPIALIETDVDTCTTQLRSNPPLKEDDQTFYYEILVGRRGDITFRRFQKQAGGMRQSVPATLTHEVFARLAADIAAAAE